VGRGCPITINHYEEDDDMFGFTIVQTIMLVVVILIIAALIGYIVYLAVNKKWEELRSIAYICMLQAEKNLKIEPGGEKFDAVFHLVWAGIPKTFPFILLSTFFDENMVKTRLQEWYNDIKDFLDDGDINGSQPSKTGESINIRPATPTPIAIETIATIRKNEQGLP